MERRVKLGRRGGSLNEKLVEHLKQEAWQQGHIEGYDKGYAAGRGEGFAAGHESAKAEARRELEQDHITEMDDARAEEYKRGRDDGNSYGYQRGFSDGYEKGEDYGLARCSFRRDEERNIGAKIGYAKCRAEHAGQKDLFQGNLSDEFLDGWYTLLAYCQRTGVLKSDFIALAAPAELEALRKRATRKKK